MSSNKKKSKNTQPKDNSLILKVSQKGAISIYGLNRFPVTLYIEQWKKILSNTNQLLQFIEDHSHELTTKDAPLNTKEETERDSDTEIEQIIKPKNKCTT